MLVSDGIDTCAPPPVCEVAADLADRGVDIIINTVGFNVDAAELGDAPAIDSPAAEAEQVTPGVWFDDAAELTPGETVAAEIVPGETQFFRLPLEYGQQLGAVIEPVAESNDFADVRVGEQLAYTAYNEARAEVPLTRSNSFIGVQRPEATGYAAPVLFSNRYGGADGEGSPEATVEKLWLDGDQYFAVTFEKTFSQEEIDAQTQLPTLTYHLVADAVGDPVPGPSFAAVEAAAPTPASTGEEPEPSTDVEPETTAEESEESGGGAGVRKVRSSSRGWGSIPRTASSSG